MNNFLCKLITIVGATLLAATLLMATSAGCKNETAKNEMPDNRIYGQKFLGPDEARDAYGRALTAPTIAAMCADYRAGFHLDRQHDSDDRAMSRRIAAPVLLRCETRRWTVPRAAAPTQSSYVFFFRNG